MLSDALAKALRRAGKPVPQPPPPPPPAPAAVEEVPAATSPTLIPAPEVTQAVAAVEPQPAQGPAPTLPPTPPPPPPPSPEAVEAVEAAVGARAAEALWRALAGAYRLHAVYAAPIREEVARLRRIDVLLEAEGLAVDGRRRSRLAGDIAHQERKVSDDLRACGPAALEEAMASLRAEGLEGERARLDQLADQLVTGTALRPGYWGNGRLSQPHPTSPIGRTATIEEAILLNATPEVAEERAAGARTRAAAAEREDAAAWAVDPRNNTPRRSFLD